MGDINGKFWFAVQSSDDASFFGGDEIEPNCIEYFFDGGDMPDIESGIGVCKQKLGGYKAELDDFFKSHEGWKDEEVAEALKVTRNQAFDLLTWYARLELGLKIQKCVTENGSCTFEAEL